MTGALDRVRRPLTAGERRVLAAKARDARDRSTRQGRMYLLLPVVFGVLWSLTIFASDVSWHAVTAFWIVIGSGISLWVVVDQRRDAREFRTLAERYDSACRRNEADVIDVRSTEYISFEEYEDEGACYAFALERGGTLILHGQQYYPSSRFPSLNFSIVRPLDESDRPVDEFLEKRGPKVDPSRVVPATVKLELDLPTDIAVMDTPLEEVENQLRRRPPD